MVTLKHALAAVVAGGALALALAAAPGAQASTSQCSALGPSCGDNQNQFGNGWDVKGQAARVNNQIIAYPNTTTDPATDFIRTGTNPYRYEYAPKGVRSGLCVSDPGYDAAHTGHTDGIVLRGCNTGNYQKFQLGKASAFGQQLVNVATGLAVYTNGTRNQLTGGGPYSGGSYWAWAGGPSGAKVVAPASFRLYATADASATCQFHQEVLNAGTHLGAGAYVLVDNVPAAAPSSPPGFTTDKESVGTPRWVIEFHNGEYIFGWPTSAASSSDPSTWTWTLEPQGTIEPSYAAAVAAATAPSSGLDNWVTAAFIVDDQSAALGDVSLSGVSYGAAYTC